MKFLNLLKKIKDTDVYHDTKTVHDTINSIKQDLDDGVVFSTTETRIGTWIDGKPLYAVTINCGELYNNARKEISTSAIIPTTAKCVHIEGDCTRYNAGLHDTVSLFTKVTLALFRSEQQKIILDTDSDQTAWTAIVTLFYTKTTD